MRTFPRRRLTEDDGQRILWHVVQWLNYDAPKWADHMAMYKAEFTIRILLGSI